MQNRAKKLPKDFYQAYRSIQKYMFKMGATDWHIFNDIIELFELAVVDGRSQQRFWAMMLQLLLMNY